MTTITIVTAYFDIGRSQWTSQNGFAPRIERTTDEYMSWFSNLAQLENDMVIFTSPDLNPGLRKSGEENQQRLLHWISIKNFVISGAGSLLYSQM